MKRNLIPVTVIILILMSTAGCSVVRLAENAVGYGVKRTPAGDTEIRRAQLSRQDLRLGISATGSGISLQLRVLPYYHLEQRQTFTSRARLTGLDIAIGLTSAGFLGWVAYDNWSGNGTYVISDDGSFTEGRIFDWEGADLWQKAVMIGVPADFALAAVLHTLSGRTTTPWEGQGEEEGTLQWLKRHPYRLELPGYNLRKDYRTTSGAETIAIRGFLEGVKNPAPFLETDTLQIRAFTEFEGKPYEQTLTLTGAARLKPFRDFARVALPAKDTRAVNTPPATSRPKATDTVVKETPPDTTPPTLTILQPVRDAGNVVTIDPSPLPITVRVTDESGIVAVKINGLEATALGNNEFSRTIPYNANLKSVEITAMDTVGNTDSKSFSVVHQQKPLSDPVVTPGPLEDNFAANSPAEREDPRLVFADRKLEDSRRQTSNKAVFELEFFVFDESPIKAVVVTRSDDNTAYPVSKGNRDYIARLQLKEGENTFRIQVTDQWDNHELETVTLTYRQADGQAPTFTSLSVDGIQVEEKILVRGGSLDQNLPIVVTNATPPMRGSLYDESGIASVSVKINNEPQETLGLQQGTQFQKKLSLDYGQNQIRITATDARGNSDETEFTIYQRPNRDGKDFALFFATNKYERKKDSGITWGDLTTAIPDAKEIERKLRDNYGFTTKRFEDPTRRQLLDTLSAYKDRFIDESGAEFNYKDGSQLIIYFAGHGYYNEVTESGYIITKDSDHHTIDTSLTTAVPHHHLRKLIDLIRCKRVLVLLDTCASGTFDPEYKPKSSLQLRSLVDEGTLLDQINTKLKLTARWVLTSASSEYVSDDSYVFSDDGIKTKGHSPFAMAFMAALDTNGGPDNLLRLGEIWQKIWESKDADTYNKIEQNPAIAGLETFERPEPRKGQFGAKEELYEESDFLLFPKVK